MKRFFAVLLIAVMLVSFVPVLPMGSVSTEAAKNRDYEIGDTCYDMIEKWFGDDAELFSIDSENEKEQVKATIQSYMEIRRQSVYDDSEIENAQFLSDDIIALENERREAFVEFAERIENELKDAANNITFNSIKEEDGMFVVQVREWVFYDYESIDREQEYVDVSGFGVNHTIELEKGENGFVIITDEYDEFDMLGIYTLPTPREEYEFEGEEVEEESDDEDEASLFGVEYYYSYKPSKAVSYSDRYATSYNTSQWPDYNIVDGKRAGDCANFTSQSIYAGGMPMTPSCGRSYCYSCCWFHANSNKQQGGTTRSASWTGAHELRYYMSRNRGELINSPDWDEYYAGSPVFYDWDYDNDWDHAAICVGYNNSGSPIVNSHNGDHYHAVYNYKAGAYSTVQLTTYNPDDDDDDDDEEEEEDIPVTSLTLDSYEKHIYHDSTTTLTATVGPSNATNKKVTWSSSNSSIASVTSTGDQTCKITAKKQGETVITAKAGNKTSQCKIYVENRYHPYSVSISPYTVTIDKGDTYYLTASVSPSYVTDDSVTWKSSNSSIVSVNKDGKITAKQYSEEPVTITATANDDYDGEVYGTCKVYVKYYYPTSVVIDDVSDYYPVELELGKTKQLTATVYPSNASNKNVIWKSSNDDYVTVTKDGKIKAVGATLEPVTITVTCEDESEYGYTLSDTCQVKVKYVPATSITLNKTSTVIPVKESETLIATVLPSDATFRNDVEWSSEDTDIVTVKNGKVTAKGEGTATIKASVEGRLHAYCTVKVKYVRPESITLSDSHVDLLTKETHTLDYTINPALVSNDKVIWTSSDDSVATVKNGKITAKGNGTAVITATCADKSELGLTVSDICSVTVREYKHEIVGSKLIITGKGKIEDFASASNQPWNSEYITEIEIKKGVTAIGKNAFREMPYVKKVTIPSTVKEIGYAAFYNCTALNEVDSLQKVVSISDYAFRGCSKLYTIDIKKGLSYIGEYAFDRTGYANTYTNWSVGGLYVGTNLVQTTSGAPAVFTVKEGTTTIADGAFDAVASKLTKLNLADSVNVICPNALSGCTNLNTVKLGKGIKALDGTVFEDCTSLENFELSEKNKSFAVEDGILYKKGLTAVISCPVGKDADRVVLPEKVTTIGTGAFAGCSIGELVLPAKLKTIEEDAFSGASVGTIQYMKYEKDWEKVNIADGNDEIKYGDIYFLVAVEYVEFNYEKLERGLKSGGIYLGSRVNVYPSNATNTDLTWTSSSKKIATVDQYGDVTFLKPGKVKITATSVEGKKKDTVEITIIDDMIHPERVEISDTEITLDVADGVGLSLDAVVYPSNADVKDVTWKSSSAKVATVDEDGYITPLKNGKATITVTTVDGGKKATCTVNVIDSTIYAKKVTISEKKMTVYAGEDFTLFATIEPENVTFDFVEWNSSKPSVATVDEDGNVTTLSPGSATITATSGDGKKKATCTVKVLDPTIYAKKITLNSKKETLYVGDDFQLEAEITPDDVTHDFVTWKSSKPSVATVDDDGNVTALKKGSATITATTGDGKKKATCKITVKD